VTGQFHVSRDCVLMVTGLVLGVSSGAHFFRGALSVKLVLWRPGMCSSLRSGSYFAQGHSLAFFLSLFFLVSVAVPSLSVSLCCPFFFFQFF